MKTNYKIIYVTGNKFKLKMAESILEPLGIKVESKKIIDLPEIQSDNIEDVAIFSAKYARNILNESVLKNDSGLVIPELNNFPTAYSKYIESTITEDGILKLMEGKKNREAYFLEVLAFAKIDGEVKVFVSKTEGSIALNKSGENGWGYDKIFIPKGECKTLASFNEKEKIRFFNNDAYNELANYLKNID